MKKISHISHGAVLLLVDIFLLLVDILVFTWQTGRVLILPTRRRKGNILSSLLSFFVGLLEKVISFEKSVLRQPVVFKHRYVKKVLVLVASFLFLLSSIEWTVGPEWGVGPGSGLTVEPAAERAVAAERTVAAERIVAAERTVAPVSSRELQGKALDGTRDVPDDLREDIFTISGGAVTTVKRHIRYCVFRI